MIVSMEIKVEMTRDGLSFLLNFAQGSVQLIIATEPGVSMEKQQVVACCDLHGLIHLRPSAGRSLNDLRVSIMSDLYGGVS